MGVKIGELVERRIELKLSELSGKRVALDAFNAMYQFLAKVRQPDGTPLMTSRGEITSVHSGMFYRTANLLKEGIIPIYVFDGEKPIFKSRAIEERVRAREEAEIKWKEALEMGDIEEARKYAQAALNVTEEMVEDCKTILRLMGLPVVQAPSEGEAQAAYMASKGDVWAAASQDYDSLLFGSPRLVRNLTITGKRKLPGKDVYVDVNPELIELEDVLRSNGINREQLIMVGILVGTDYNLGGVKGIGVKRALELVRKYRKPEELFSKVPWDFEFDPVSIYEFFLNPPKSDDYELSINKPRSDELLKFMVEEHEFSEERVRKVITEVEEAYRMLAGGGLESWF
ncbi:MAG: flap endonuclease-1 [Candidatus Korarchaeum sp.]